MFVFLQLTSTDRTDSDCLLEGLDKEKQFDNTIVKLLLA